MFMTMTTQEDYRSITLDVACRLEDTRLSMFAQFQLLALRRVTGLIARKDYRIADDSSQIGALLAYVGDHKNPRMVDAYKTFANSLGRRDKVILSQDFGVLLEVCKAPN